MQTLTDISSVGFLDDRSEENEDLVRTTRPWNNTQSSHLLFRKKDLILTCHSGWQRIWQLMVICSSRFRRTSTIQPSSHSSPITQWTWNVCQVFSTFTVFLLQTRKYYFLSKSHWALIALFSWLQGCWWRENCGIDHKNGNTSVSRYPSIVTEPIRWEVRGSYSQAYAVWERMWVSGLLPVPFHSLYLTIIVVPAYTDIEFFVLVLYSIYCVLLCCERISQLEAKQEKKKGKSWKPEASNETETMNSELLPCTEI